MLGVVTMVFTYLWQLLWPSNTGTYDLAFELSCMILSIFLCVADGDCDAFFLSFCNLTTVFAVEVYGAPGTPLTGYLMLLFTCLVGAGILVATYFLYRHLLKTGKVCS